MLWDKTVAILLIFSITNVLLAAPAVLPRQRLSVTDGSDDELMDRSFLTIPSELSRQDSVARSPPGSLHQDFASLSGALRSRGDQPIQPSGKESQPLPQPPPDEPPPASGAEQLHKDPPSTSGAPQLHDDSPSGPGAESLHDDSLPWWQSSNSFTEIEEVGPEPHPDVELGQMGMSRGSSASASDWADAHAIEAVEAFKAFQAAAAKQAEAGGLRQKLTSGLCHLGFRCWPLRRSVVKWSPE